MNLGFDLVVESDGPDRAEDAPTSASMREGARGGERRRPSTDEKKVKNRLRRQAGFDGDEADDLEAVEGHILAAMAQPGRPWAELQALAAELEDIRSERRTAALTAADQRLADEVIHDHLTPVLTHIRHTSSTDWIGTEAAGLPDALKDHQFGSDDDEDDDGDKKASMTNTVAAEASLWFSRVSAAVKADRDEFAEQAQGMAARVAGQMAQGHPAATRAFLDRVAFLHRQAEIGPDGVKPWGMEDVHGRDPLMVDPEQSLADEDQSGGGESSLPIETTADPDPMDSEFWDDGASHEVPSTRAPNVTGSKTAVSLTNVGIDSSTGNGTGTDPSGKKVQFRLSAEDKKALQGVLYSDLAVNFTGVDVDESEIITSASKTAAEGEGGSTCSSCGDPIERDPAGEDPRTWHHTNGEKHDHEASPGGGSDSKESSFRVQAARSLSEIAREISADWKNVYFGAVPYLQAMRQLDKITDNYGQDGADDIVIYFLSNATTWKGETARRIKAELKAMTKGRYGSKTAKKPCKFASEGNCSDDIIELWHGRSEPTYICGYHEQSKGQEKFSSLRVTAATCFHCNQPIGPDDPGYDESWGDVQLHDRCAPLEGIRNDDDRREWWNRHWNAADPEMRAGWAQMGVTPTNNSIRQSTLADKQNGNATSGLPLEPEGDDVDETMWPWEITKKTTDAAKTAEARCPYCGHIGCSPTCPGPAGMAEDRDGGGGGSYAICPNCGGGAARINGQVVCDHCGEGHEPGSMFDTDPESAQNRRFTRGSRTAGWQADLDRGIFSGGVDNVTKGMLRSVLEGLRPDNAEKFANMPLEQAVALGWRLVSGGVPRDPATFAALAAEAAKGDFLHGEDCGEPTDPTDNEGPCTKTLGHGGPHKGESKTSAFRSTVQANLARMGG